MEILEKIKSFLLKDIDFLKLGELSPAVYLMAGGAILVLIAFFIALGIKGGSKVNKFRKHLDETTAYVNAGEDIDETNVDGLNARIQDARMPHAVAKGWGNFLDQQVGYPSDYIVEKDVIGDKKSCNFKKGNAFFGIVSWIVILIVAGLTAILHLDILQKADWSQAKSVADGLKFALPVIGMVVVPIIVYIIFNAFLHLAGSNQYKKTVQSFRKFQDALDSKVIIFREPQDEFIAENIDEINSAIDEILANKLGDSEILEIVTPPTIPEEQAVEEVAPAPAEEPAAEPTVEEEVAAEVAPQTPVAPAAPEEEPITEEARQSRFIGLISIVSRLLVDPNATEEDVIELAVYLDSVKESGLYPEQEEQELLGDCLYVLAGFHDDKYGK